MGAISNVAYSQWLAAYQQSDYDPYDEPNKINERETFLALSRTTASYARVSAIHFTMQLQRAACKCLTFPLCLDTLLTSCQALRWLLLYIFIHPLSIICYFLVTLLVLDRFMIFSKLKGASVKSFWDLLIRVIIAVACAGTAASLSCSFAAVPLVTEAIGIFDDVSAGYRNASATKDATASTSKAARLFSFLFAFESIMLLILTVLFLVVGLASVRRVRYTLQSMNDPTIISMRKIKGHGLDVANASMSDAAASAGRQLLRQILGTCAVIFVSMLIRATYSAFFLLAIAFQNADADDANKCVSKAPYKNRCDCYNQYSNMLTWNFYTPSFYFAVALMSQPAALLVVLWGMTSGQMLAIMKAARVNSFVEP